MNVRTLSSALSLAIPGVLHAQYLAASSVYTSSNTLPNNLTIEQSLDSDGGGGFASSESAAAISTGRASASAGADLAKVVLRASVEAKAPAPGQRHYASAGANVHDFVNFVRTGKDIVIPMRFALSGLGVSTNASTSGTFVAYDPFGSVIRMDVDLRNGIPVADKTWTIPATSSGRYRMTFQIGAQATSDAGQGDMAAKDLALRFRWDLPAGVTYTSDSGVFDPERIHPVPEPASLVALGVGGVGLLRRRRA